MIDIHTHILPLVDDGSRSVEQSLEMLNEEIVSGVDTIVLTPHYKKSIFEISPEEIERVFLEFKEKVESMGLPVKLILGREINLRTNYNIDYKGVYLSTIGDTKACLLEFDYYHDCDIADVAYTYNVLGYKPIIAHVERYEYARKPEIIQYLRRSGAYIQVNATGITGGYGLKVKRFVLKLIKLGLVDFVASDVHAFRNNRLKESYDLVKKKFGTEVAEDLFTDNAKKLLNI